MAKKFFLFALLTVFSLPFAVVPPASISAATLPEGLYAEMRTSRGTVILALEFKKTPMTVMNFVGLAEGTIAFKNRTAKRFYDGLTFHRVVKDFMIQGGDPQGNGSQFFITHRATPWLDGKHTVFGRVVSGQDVVGAVQQGDKITAVKILKVGREAKSFKATQASFDALVKEAGARAREKRAKERLDSLATIGKTWPHAKKTKSGLMYVVVKRGSGPSPGYGDTVTVHYTGTFLDGSVFDSSRTRGAPASFRVGEVIEGWNEALLTMCKGEKRTLIVPSELGYGEEGYPGAIPPDSFLVFEVELIDFKK